MKERCFIAHDQRHIARGAAQMNQRRLSMLLKEERSTANSPDILADKATNQQVNIETAQ